MKASPFSLQILFTLSCFAGMEDSKLLVVKSKLKKKEHSLVRFDLAGFELYVIVLAEIEEVAKEVRYKSCKICLTL